MTACYICSRRISGACYWIPLPRVGSYAVICADCLKKIDPAERKNAERC